MGTYPACFLCFPPAGGLVFKVPRSSFQKVIFDLLLANFGYNALISRRVITQ